MNDVICESPKWTGACRPLDMMEVLVAKKVQLEAQLKETNDAIAFMQNNPTFMTGLNLLARATGKHF